jgi:hypothetical protein
VTFARCLPNSVAIQQQRSGGSPRQHVTASPCPRPVCLRSRSHARCGACAVALPRATPLRRASSRAAGAWAEARAARPRRALRAAWSARARDRRGAEGAVVRGGGLRRCRGRAQAAHRRRRRASRRRRSSAAGPC